MMRIISKMFLLLTITAIQILAQVNVNSLNDLLPDLDELPGFSQDETKEFSGDDLFMLINGGAEVYHEFGFDWVISTKYLSDSIEIKVEIYEMSDPYSALGIFLNSNPVALSEVMKHNFTFEKEFYSTHVKDKYYIVVSSEKYSDASQVIDNILNTIFSNIKQSILNLHAFSSLPQGEGNPEVKIIKGNLALSNIYYFSPKNIFQIENGIYGNYGNEEVIILTYKDKSSIKQIFDGVVEQLKSRSKFLDKTLEGQLFILKDKKGKTIIVQQSENGIVIGLSDNQSRLKDLLSEIDK